MILEAKDLIEGDLVDLEGDMFADPNKNNVSFKYDFQEVAEINWENPNCVAIGFKGFDIVGFPPWHKLYVTRPNHYIIKPV